MCSCNLSLQDVSGIILDASAWLLPVTVLEEEFLQVFGDLLLIRLQMDFSAVGGKELSPVLSHLQVFQTSIFI